MGRRDKVRQVLGRTEGKRGGGACVVMVRGYLTDDEKQKQNERKKSRCGGRLMSCFVCLHRWFFVLWMKIPHVCCLLLLLLLV